MNSTKNILLTLLVATVSLTACDEARIFEENIDIPENQWDQKNKIKFDVQINENKIPYNFYINLRHAGDYPYNNLFMFLTTKTPGGKISTDTLECVLAKPDGDWLGDGSGDIFDHQILFKKNVQFPEKGLYHFELEQAMRIKKLPLVMDVGIRVEKSI